MSDSLGRLVGLIDLTSLGEADDEATVDRLCARASTPLGPVAAVCVWPRFVARCARALGPEGPPVAGVANFPAGGADVAAAVAETRALVANGAREVDLVMPYRDWLAGRRGLARDLVAACAGACGEARLKVIVESCAFDDEALLASATRDVIEAGAHFVKTSTGKGEAGATPAAARTMLGAIADSGRPVGFKAAGGIRTRTDAQSYVDLATEIMGAGWVSPDTFRVGASGLLDALLAESVAGEAASR